MRLNFFLIKNLTNSQITLRSKVFNNKTLWNEIWREKKGVIQKGSKTKRGVIVKSR